MNMLWDSTVPTLLTTQGFAVVSGLEMCGNPISMARSLSSLLDDTRLDTHGGPGITRFKRHDKLVYLPWSGYISRLPLPCYYRDLPSWPALGRQYVGLGDDVLKSHAFAQLIERDVRACPMSAVDGSYPIELGINLIRVQAANQMTGSSPNEPHRDGERYIVIHLIRRHNIVGGENGIWSDVGNCLWTGVLHNPFDSLFVDDVRLMHHIGPIAIGSVSQAGFRDVLIVDITPMRASKGVLA